MEKLQQKLQSYEYSYFTRNKYLYLMNPKSGQDWKRKSTLYFEEIAQQWYTHHNLGMSATPSRCNLSLMQANPRFLVRTVYA